MQGNTGTSTITTAVSGGFNSAITLSDSGEGNLTVAFSPNPIAAPGSGTSTMTITIPSNAPIRSHTINIIAKGGGVSQKTSITVAVTQ